MYNIFLLGSGEDTGLTKPWRQSSGCCQGGGFLLAPACKPQVNSSACVKKMRYFGAVSVYFCGLSVWGRNRLGGFGFG